MRTLVHVLLSIALWVVFVVYWDIVTRQTIGKGTLLAIQVISVLVVTGTILTSWWIVHNLRLGRRNRRRGQRVAPPEALATDALGRAVETPGLATLKLAAAVEIAIVEDRKRYVPVDPTTLGGGS